MSEGLARRLGLEIIHHELVEQDIVNRSGLRESEVRRYLQGSSTFMESWRVDRKRLSHFTAQEILELAARDNVLIRGWGATYLLREVPHVVCVRICAPMELRTRVLMQRTGIGDPIAAGREIERSDAAHNGTMQRMFGVDWTDASLYAVTLNTARVAPEDCVEHIVRLVESPAFRVTTESQGALMDRLIEVRVQSALRERFHQGPQAMGIEVVVKDGLVTLNGAVSDDRVMTEIVRAAGTVDGVQRVESRIRHLSFSRGRE